MIASNMIVRSLLHQGISCPLSSRPSSSAVPNSPTASSCRRCASTAPMTAPPPTGISPISACWPIPARASSSLKRRMSSAAAASPMAAWGSTPTTTSRRWRVSSRTAGGPAPPSSASRSRMPAARPPRNGRGRAVARCRPIRTRGRRSPHRPFRSGRTGTCRAWRPWTTSRGCARPSSIQRSARCGSASTPSNCTTRTVTWRIRSCRRCPTIAPTSTAARWRTACGSGWRSRRRCGRRCRRALRLAPASPAATGATKGSPSTTR